MNFSFQVASSFGAAVMSSSALVIDADGTLIHLSEAVGITYRRILGDFGYVVAQEAVDAAIKQEWKSFVPHYLNSEQQYRTNIQREKQVWYQFIRAVLKRMDITATDSLIVESMYAEFAKGSSRKIDRELLVLLKEAKHRGFVVALATNNDLRILQIVEEFKLTDTFDRIFTAGQLGWKKPSTEFFTSLAASLSIPCRNIVHLGNDDALDVVAARAAGCRAVLYGPGDSVKKEVLELLRGVDSPGPS